MPEPRPISSYPLEYFALFERAAGEEFTISLSSPKEAIRMRNRLYAFKRAVAAEPELAGKVYLLIGLVKMRVVGSTIIAGPTEPTKFKGAINDALGSTSPPDVQSDSSSSSTGRGTTSVCRQHDADELSIVPGEVSK